MHKFVRLVIVQNASIHEFDTFLLFKLYSLRRIVKARLGFFPVHRKSRIVVEPLSKISGYIRFLNASCLAQITLINNFDGSSGSSSVLAF